MSSSKSGTGEFDPEYFQRFDLEGLVTFVVIVFFVFVFTSVFLRWDLV